MLKRKVLISGLTFLGAASIATAAAVSLTSCAEEVPSEPNTVKAKLEKLFTFGKDKLLPCEENKSAMLDTTYADCAEAIDNGQDASSEIMDLYKEQMCTKWGLTSADIVAKANKQDFSYNFSINLNDSISQKLYNKTFKTVCNDIQGTEDYADLFNNGTPSEIAGIKLVFEFNMLEIEGKQAVVSNNIMGFTLDQRVLLTFTNGTLKEIKNIISDNNNQFNTKKMLYFVEFDSNSELPNGSSVDIEAVSFTEEQVNGLMKVIEDNIRNWTKDDILYADKSVAELPKDPNDSENENYKTLVESVNNFFVDSGLDLTIMGMNVANTVSRDGKVLWENKDNFVGIKPFFIFNEFTYISLPNNKFYYSYDKYSGKWFIFVSDNNPVWTSAKMKTLKLADDQIEKIKEMIGNSSLSAIDYKNTNINEEPFSSLVDEISTFISEINPEFGINGNIWGGAGSYEFDEKLNKWTMSFGTEFYLVDEEVQSNSFINLDISKKYYAENSAIYPATYALGTFIIYSGIETSIPPELVISNDAVNQINDILKDFAGKLTTELGNAELFSQNQEVVGKLNGILNSINPSLQVTGFNVWGNWDQQQIDNGKKTVKLGINVNLEECGFYKDDVDFSGSDLFTYDSQYGVILPKTPYLTNIDAKA